MPWLVQHLRASLASNSKPFAMATGSTSVIIQLSASFRFFYENKKVLTKEQIKQIKRVSLARVLCDSSDGMQSVPRHAFDQLKGAEMLSCLQVDGPNYKAWKEDF
jgi:hypothetical protein